MFSPPLLLERGGGHVVVVSKLSVRRSASSTLVALAACTLGDEFRNLGTVM